MTKTKLFFLFLSFFLLSAMHAQNTGTLRGQIVDRQSQFPLYGVQVIVPATDPLLGAVTDENGYYRIVNVPVGRVNIDVKYTGYAPLSFSNLLLNSAIPSKSVDPTRLTLPFTRRTVA